MNLRSRVSLVGTSGDLKEFDVGANPDPSNRVRAVCDFFDPADFTFLVSTPDEMFECWGIAFPVMAGE